VYCTYRESVNHLFFHCPIIVEFRTKIINSHPQLRDFTINFFWTFEIVVGCYLIFITEVLH
jgi:hypothetical protein